MGIFDKLFNRKTKAKKIELQHLDFDAKYSKATVVFEAALSNYNASACPCSFPRFLQVIGIDCSKSSYSFKCFDTELLIDLSKKYFEVTSSDRKDENTNEKWVCKTCGSTFEYGWSDFSIYVERQKLEPTELKAQKIGKNTIKPIPLFLGLYGHSYPPKTEINLADFEAFKKYILEE